MVSEGRAEADVVPSVRRRSDAGFVLFAHAGDVLRHGRITGSESPKFQGSCWALEVNWILEGEGTGALSSFLAATPLTGRPTVITAWA